jgi:GT2 family glycosyltransferase
LQLSIIIVNYNVKHLLEACLTSVGAACKNISVEIFVVDNASTDGSQAYFNGKFLNVHFLWNKENVGFAKANNSVLRETKGDYILFLNPDTVLPADCLEKCLQFFSAHPDCGGLGVRITDENGIYRKESKRGFPGAATSLFKMLGLHTLFPRSEIFARYYLGHLSENETNEIEVLSGAFMMLSRKALEKVKGFDEAFFMYAEDIDLSCRIIKAGFKNYYFPDTSIIHFKGKSTKKKSKKYISDFYGAMKIFVNKYYPQQSIGKLFLLLGIEIRKYIALIMRLF